MTSKWHTEAALLVVIAAMFAAAALAWPGAPDQIPVHWNAAGQVDRFGGKFEGLFLLPLFALALYLLLRYLPAIDPGRANYARFGGAYTVIRAGILLLMGGIHALVIAWTRGVRVDMSSVTPMLVGVLFLCVGAVLGKVRPNWFVGVRTPWTMSSKQAWVKTHRLGGFLFMGLGLLFIAIGLTSASWSKHLAIGGVLGVVVVLTAYWYWVWRSDPEKLAPVGTQPADD